MRTAALVPLAACFIFNKDQETVIINAHLSQFISAAVTAYAVGSNTPVREYPGGNWIDWLDEPTPFVAGGSGIDACYVAKYAHPPKFGHFVKYR